MLPSSSIPSWLILRIWSSAWSHGTDSSSTVTGPATPGWMTMLSPLMRASERSTSVMSASFKLMLMGAP